MRFLDRHFLGQFIKGLINCFIVANINYPYLVSNINLQVVGVNSKSAMVVSAQVSPISESLLPSDMESSLPLISPEQYASRSALMSSLIVSWSPVLQSTRVQPDSCNRCVMLAVGGKSGNISFWRLCQPECYTIEHDTVFVDPMLIGFFPAHNSWITTITWGMFAPCTSISQLILVTGGSDGRWFYLAILEYCCLLFILSVCFTLLHKQLSIFYYTLEVHILELKLAIKTNMWWICWIAIHIC